MSVEWRTDVLPLGHMLGFCTCNVDSRILRPTLFAAVDSPDGQGPWRPEKSA
jgi:hypothetical protein